MKTYLFCIGGTGARVLKALSVYMASNVQITGTIVPILLDMDMRNGDTQRTLKLLDAYRYLQQENQRSSQEPRDGYFTNAMGTLSSTNSNKTETLPEIQDSFQLDFENSNQTFGEYIGFDTLSELNQDFMRSLFDNSDATHPGAELQLNLLHGFKGNPNIGSVVFNNMINTPEFQYFQQSFTTSDRIFIVSSIFGGTGASGFPQLVKNLRNSNVLSVRHASIGALVVMPYFQVKKEADSSIDSEAFNSKTKAALHYYADELSDKVDATYYISDQPGGALENNEGGADQENKAHVVEFIAAMGIQHFINAPLISRGSVPQYFEYGIKDLPLNSTLQSLSFKDFYADEQPDFKKFATFIMTVKYLREGLPESEDDIFYKDLQLSKKLHSDYFYVRLRQFCDSIWTWLEEVSNNERGFVGFNLNNSYNTFITGTEVKLDPYMMGLKNPISQRLNEVHKKRWNKGGLTEHQYFLELIHTTFQELFDTSIGQLPTR